MHNFIEKREEEEEVTAWNNSQDDWTISIMDLAHLIKSGFHGCTGFCASREYSGTDCCKCIRETFPNPDAYAMYLDLKTEYDKSNSLLAKNIVLKAVVLPREQYDRPKILKP